MSTTQMRTALLQNLSPFLNDFEAMQQINAFVIQLCVPSPCEYTVEEAQHRAETAANSAISGEHGMSNAEFKSQVRAWYK